MSVNSCALIKVNGNLNKRVKRGGLLTKPANNMTVAEGFCESEDEDDDDEALIDADFNSVKIKIGKKFDDGSNYFYLKIALNYSKHFYSKIILFNFY